jgi:alanine-glyoxylate transaminase/serine-glyoxylate transaminase/serine-pyruvate transaminase
MTYQSGRHFLQLPGPTNVPERVLRAMSRPTMDHRSPDFGRLTKEIFEGLKPVFGTTRPILIFPSSGNGGWEAALVNTLSPGDRVVVFETGEFARLWAEMARRLGLDVHVADADWTRGVDAGAVEEVLTSDRAHAVRAVLVVHNETSTGAATRVAEVRKAIDRAKHPALLLVDAVSAAGSMEICHDAWGIDVTLAGSQKGLMLPPGLSFNVISEKALAASRAARLPRSYWAWDPMLEANATGFFTYTPAINLLYGLREAIAMLDEEGLPRVFARHRRLAAAARAAVCSWKLEIACRVPEDYSSVVTTVMMPDGHDSDNLRTVARERYNLSIGAGLGRLKGKAFRIGHLGDFNDLMLVGTLGGIEMSLASAGVPFTAGGVGVAIERLLER